MGTRKITRHEMKQDEFVSTVGRLTLWAEDHLAQIGWAAGGLVAAAALVLGVWSWRTSRALAGEAALAGVVEAYAASVGEAGGASESFPSRDAKFRAVLERADAVLRAQGSSPVAERARYYRGLALFELGQMADARQALQDFADRNRGSFLAPHARRKLAAIDEREGNLAQACDTYRQLTEVQVAEFPPELALIDLGQCLTASGAPDGAAEAFRKVIDQYPDSTYAADAQQRLLELEGSAG